MQKTKITPASNMRLLPAITLPTMMIISYLKTTKASKASKVSNLLKLTRNESILTWDSALTRQMTLTSI